MDQSPAIRVSRVGYRYGQRAALVDVSLNVEPGEIFAFVGPNGSGKTTLFRLLSTLMPMADGQVEIFALDLRQQLFAIRSTIGVVFQSPSLDKKLTVEENLRQHGRMYGFAGAPLKKRVQQLLELFALVERRRELAETLSGGLRRRVELAGGMIHQPRLLLLDEPSTGLDPGARGDLWRYLRTLRDEAGVTIVLSTHLLEEADKADRIAILHEGRLVALDTPAALRATLGGDSITIETSDPAGLATAVAARFGCPAKVLGGAVRLEQAAGHQWIAKLVEAFPGQIDSITLGKPTLEDVFIARTGARFWQPAGDVSSEAPAA